MGLEGSVHVTDPVPLHTAEVTMTFDLGGSMRATRVSETAFCIAKESATISNVSRINRGLCSLSD